MIEIHIKKQIHSFSCETDLEIDLEIARGEFISLFGRSGVGKTTLLRVLSGLIIPDDGYIKVDGEYWFNKNKRINVSPQRRNIGFVFQDHSLFPNMTVRENLGFVSPDNKDKEWIAYVLKLMDIEEFSSRKPHNLSGGQKQRAALARAIVRRPKVLLLDEPFSSIDPGTRELLQQRLKVVHQELGLTSIMVSHDREEVSLLSDKIYELNAGKLVQKQQHENKYYLDKLLMRNEGNNSCLVELKNGNGKIVVEMDIEYLEAIRNPRFLIKKLDCGKAERERK